MVASFKTIACLGMVSMMAVSPTLADYTILEDTSLPSVVFIEFDGDAASPTVINAPESSSASVSQDPALPASGSDVSADGEGENNQAGTSSSSSSNGSSASSSVEERVKEKIAELEDNSNERAESEAADVAADAILQDAGLR